MRIAYLSSESITAESGVIKKIARQSRHWEAAGHEVALFVLARDAGEPWEGLARHEVSTVPAVGTRGLISGSMRQAKQVEAWRPDVVYLRFGLALPGWIKLAARHATVLEVNSDDLAERRSRLSLSRYLVHRLTRGALLVRAAGIVCVTHELAERHRSFAGRRAVIANGVDLEVFDQRAAPANDPPRLIFLGNLQQPWGGFEKLLRLAAARPDWRIDLVGPIEDRQRRRCLPNMRSHGPCGCAAFADLLQSADVAIGPLALHEKYMEEACSLKVREYLANGLPTIIAHRDTDFPPPEPKFLLRIPNTKDNVETHLPDIVGFVERMIGTRVAREDVHHLDASIKERQRIEFFEHVRGNDS